MFPPIILKNAELVRVEGEGYIFKLSDQFLVREVTLTLDDIEWRTPYELVVGGVYEIDTWRSNPPTKVVERK